MNVNLINITNILVMVFLASYDRDEDYRPYCIIRLMSNGNEEFIFKLDHKFNYYDFMSCDGILLYGTVECQYKLNRYKNLYVFSKFTNGVQLHSKVLSKIGALDFERVIEDAYKKINTMKSSKADCVVSGAYINIYLSISRSAFKASVIIIARHRDAINFIKDGTAMRSVTSTWSIYKCGSNYYLGDENIIYTLDIGDPLIDELQTQLTKVLI